MQAIRKEYEKLGVDDFYILHHDDYKNPHEQIISKLISYAKEYYPLGNHILDLCCGSGEVSSLLLDRDIVGADPYTGAAYEKRIGKAVLPFSFKDIAMGKLEENYDSIICSFALHLCETSLLPYVLFQLGQHTKYLVILSPHKRPDCNGVQGWELIDTQKINKVTMKLYENTWFQK